MGMLYDTTTVHPLDRYEYYRAGAADEVAPVSIHGRAPDRLLATMSVARLGDVELADLTWAADAEVTALRTARLIRAGDPDCYRMCLSVDGGDVSEQAGHQVRSRARDIALYDVSLPWRAIHPSGAPPMRRILLTLPRAAVPVAPDRVRPLIGTVFPRSMPGRGLAAQFLLELADAAALPQAADPVLDEAVRACAVALIRERLGHPEGFTSQTRRLVYTARVRAIIRRHLGDPALDTERIARAAHISPRYLHRIFQDAELRPMQLVKRLRLEQCRRSLRDPALSTKSIKDIIAAHGYVRPDRFARDFKQLFGVSARDVRHKVRRW